MNEINIQLSAKQQEFLKASYRYPVTFYGGAKGGGKSYSLRNIALIRAVETPALQVGLFRETFPELRGNLIDPLFNEHPFLEQYYNKSEHMLRLPNRSVIEFNHCEGMKHVKRYQGREYHIIGIEEVGQWDEDTYSSLRGSNRTSRADVTPAMLLTGNPGGKGHKWLKRLFVQRQFRPEEDPADYHFIQAKVFDNYAIMTHDPGYLKKLKSEKNLVLRKAYLDGDWDIFAGQFFDEWRREKHVITPFAIPDHWERFGAFDPGYFHPCAFGWFAVDEIGRIYMYRELVEPGLRIDQLKRKVFSYPDSIKMRHIYGGRDCWAKGRDGTPCIEEQWRRFLPQYRVNIIPANTDRIQGASQMRAFLAWQDLPSGMEGPRLLFFDTCTRTIDCLPSLIHDEQRPEDVLKVDSSEANPFGGDDPYDMVRYFIMSRPRPSQKAEEDEVFIPKSYDQRVHDFMKRRRKQVAKMNKGKGFDKTLGGKW